jgi:hypothetical protein
MAIVDWLVAAGLVTLLIIVFNRGMK